MRRASSRRLDQNYLLDVMTLRFKAINDGVLSFGRAAGGVGTGAATASSSAISAAA